MMYDNYVNIIKIIKLINDNLQHRSYLFHMNMVLCSPDVKDNIMPVTNSFHRSDILVIIESLIGLNH